MVIQRHTPCSGCGTVITATRQGNPETCSPECEALWQQEIQRGWMAFGFKEAQRTFDPGLEARHVARNVWHGCQVRYTGPWPKAEERGEGFETYARGFLRGWQWMLEKWEEGRIVFVKVRV